VVLVGLYFAVRNFHAGAALSACKALDGGQRLMSALSGQK
jgi:hypothetical protein